MITIDFEFRITSDRDYVLVCCVVRWQSGGILRYDLRTQVDKDHFKRVFELANVKGIICFNASAEIKCLIQLGIDVTKLDVVDLWVEAKMLMLTHRSYYANSTGLEAALKLFLPTRAFYADVGGLSKEAARDLIINNDTYSASEFDSILVYCGQDVLATWELYVHLRTVVHTRYEISFDSVLERGRFARNCAISYTTTSGFPIDTELLSLLEDNAEVIKSALAEEVNNVTGYGVYRKHKQVKHKDGSVTLPYYSFNADGFESYIESLGLSQMWQKTDTGKLSTTDDYFEELSSFLENNRNYSGIELIRQTRKLLQSLNTKEPLSRLLVNDGYIVPVEYPYHQKTGRSSPKPSMGFILNMSPVLRCLIQPKEGYCFVGADFTAQEIVVAGLLSNDDKLLEAYKNDIYLTTAKLLGEEYVPSTATKKTHGELRQSFKGIVLGIFYGKKKKSVARDLQCIFNCSDSKADMLSARLFEEHKKTFAKYWSFVEDCRLTYKPFSDYVVNKWQITDDWCYFVDSGTALTQLQNAPIQATGAIILRRARNNCVEAGLDVVCGLHDAIYVNCKVEELEETKEKMLSLMAKAFDSVFPDKIIGNELKVVMAGDNYVDPRAVATLNKLSEKVPILSEKISRILKGVEK